MRPGLIALGLSAALVASGCQYLLGYDPNDPPLDDFSDPTPIAVYASGRATIAIDGGKVLELDRLSSPGAMYKSFGSEANFTSDEGWYVRVSGAYDKGASGTFGAGAYLQIDRIVGTSHWSTADPSRCVVTVVAANETALRGTATCKGLRWSDTLASGPYSMEPAYVEGEAPFDAEITFEALPGPSQT